MLKFNLIESSGTEEFTIDIMNNEVIQRADKLIKAAGFGGIEVAVFSNSYTNINGGKPDIFIDVDAYSYLNLYCIYYNTEKSRFELRNSYYRQQVVFAPGDHGAEDLASDLHLMMSLVEELAELDFKTLYDNLAKDYVK